MTTPTDLSGGPFGRMVMVDPFRRFHLIRDEDPTGISGTGKICEGIQFSDGLVIIRWVTRVHSMGVFDDIQDLLDTHGHGGLTRVEWID